MSPADKWTKHCPSRRNSKCKGPEVEGGMDHSKNRRRPAWLEGVGDRTGRRYEQKGPEEQIILLPSGPGTGQGHPQDLYTPTLHPPPSKGKTLRRLLSQESLKMFKDQCRILGRIRKDAHHSLGQTPESL